MLLLLGGGLLVLRENLGGAYLNRFVSPTHRNYVVELYVYEPPIGGPAFSLYVVDSGRRHYLGYICMDGSAWSPWNDNLSWSSDGTVLYCWNSTSAAAYVFGESSVFFMRGSPKVQGVNAAKIVNEAELASVLQQHGGGGDPFFTSWREDPSNFFWCDFVPSEKY